VSGSGVKSGFGFMSGGLRRKERKRVKIMDDDDMNMMINGRMKDNEKIGSFCILCNCNEFAVFK
jgi:hypothetical protein